MAARLIRVQAPSRLHMGFVDVSGTAGRRFGSLGLTLDAMKTEVTLSRSDNGCRIDGPDRAGDLVHRYLAATGDSDQKHFSIRQDAPAHAGFGTGTQLALAIGAAIEAFHDRPIDASQIARQFGRGVRSGIGVGGFAQGGFIVDGGHGSDSAVPPVTVRLAFPEQWRILLVLDSAASGLSGDAERRAFGELAPFAPSEAHQLAHRVLVQCLPAIVESDLPAFGQAISTIQQVIGDYFAPVQGSRFTSDSVQRAVHWLAERGATGLGQSSWGPTGFAFVADQDSAQTLAQDFADTWGPSAPNLKLVVCRARNSGARVLSE